MSEMGEALGTASEGGLLARALSRRSRPDARPADGHFDESACVNCATPLIGPHCHTCGQQAHLHRTLGALGHDIMHGVLHADGKTWRTLPLLAWKPGELTRRYIHGERAKFVSPMAMFLFSIFFMFAVFQAVGITPPTDIATGEGLRANVATARAELEGEVRADRERLARLAPDDPDRAKLTARIAESTEQIADLRKVETGQLNELKVNVTDDGTIGVRFIDDGIIAKWRKSPGLMLYKLQTNSYKFSWLLIPLSLPFMWLLFAWKRGIRVYDHAIFVTYSIAFMSLLFLVVSLLVRWNAPEGLIAALVFIAPPLHLYRQLRGAYGLTRFSALWRLLVLSAMIWVIISLFVQILLVLGAF